MGSTLGKIISGIHDMARGISRKGETKMGNARSKIGPFRVVMSEA